MCIRCTFSDWEKQQNWGLEEDRKLIKLVEQGITSQIIADRLGWSQGTIIRKAQQLGLRWKQPTRIPNNKSTTELPPGRYKHLPVVAA